MWIDDAVLKRAFELQKSSDLFEVMVERIYRHILKPGDYAIDAGCNEGRHTIPLANTVGPAGLVVGFEPIPFLAQRLIDKARLFPQLRIYNKAVGEKQGKASFVIFPGRTGWSGLRRRADAGDLESRTIDVEVTPLDDLPLSQVAKLNFIKLDIEGGEFDALKGAQTLLALRKPIVIFENGGGFSAKVYKHTIDEWYEFFATIGYRVYDILGRPYAREYWNGALAPWNSIAVADGSPGARFVERDLPDLARHTMDDCDKAV